MQEQTPEQMMQGSTSSYLLSKGWRTHGTDLWLPPGVSDNSEPVSLKGALEIQLYAEELKNERRA